MTRTERLERLHQDQILAALPLRKQRWYARVLRQHRQTTSGRVRQRKVNGIVRHLVFWACLLAWVIAPACAQPLEHPQPEGSTGHYVPGVINLLGYHECPPPGFVLSTGILNASAHEIEGGYWAIGWWTKATVLIINPDNPATKHLLALQGEQVELVIRLYVRDPDD